MHSKAFLLTIGHHYDSLLKIMSTYRIEHCFLLEENINQVNRINRFLSLNPLRVLLDIGIHSKTTV